MSIKDNIKDILSLKRWFNITNAFQRQNRGQIVLDSILFDWKTAPWHKLLIINGHLFAIRLSDSFYASQLFPLWKPLNQKQTDVQYVQKMHTLISKMETTEIAHE